MWKIPLKIVMEPPGPDIRGGSQRIHVGGECWRNKSNGKKTQPQDEGELHNICWFDSLLMPMTTFNIVLALLKL